MDPDRWRELDNLLSEAMERDAVEREEWLVRRCAGDLDLLEEARTMLELEERSKGFLETPALARDPDRLANYRILRRVAAGGSAVVYEAIADGEEHSVALKVLTGSLFADERRLRRFRREVKTLARLRHPAIARILEARSTQDGQQFFAMEFVRGRRLDHYVKEAAPSLEERLWLFREVCDAIHHAHQCGVIHRDVKPSNILVDDSCRAKILDFGLARLAEADPELASSVRDTGEVMGTLPYMSPEQASGRSASVDARTDVYSLGVVLYGLMTEELPFDFAGLMPHEGLNLVCNHEPVRPSVRCRELRGDLETIILQAMHKDPEYRYRTAAELSADVGRFLEHRPIVARPPHPVQRLRATVASHKLASAVLAGVLLVLSVFSITSWVKNRELRAEHARVVFAEEQASSEAARASAEADRAKAVLDFLNDTLSSADPDRSAGRAVTVREVLDDVAGGVDTEFADRPHVAAEIHRTIGLSYLSLGRDREAARHLGSFLEISAELDVRPSLRRAEGHRRRGEAQSKLGNYEAALGDLEASLAMYRALRPDDARTAGILLALGETLFNLGRTAEAKERTSAALALIHAGGTEAGEGSIETLQLMADIRWQQGDRGLAEALYREALALQLEAAGEEHTRTGQMLAALGQLCAEAERFAEAQGFLERSLAVRLARLGATHPETVATHNNLATLYLQMGQMERAEPMLVEVLEGWRNLGLTDHEDYAITLSTLGAVYGYLDRYEDAELHFRQALDAFRGTSSGRKDSLSNHIANLARVLIPLGRVEEAEEFVYEVLELRVEVFGEESPPTAGALALLAELLLAEEDVDGALETMREAQEIRRATLPPGHSDLADGANTLAVLLQMQGELEEAEHLFRESLEGCLAVYGEAHPSTVLRMLNLGDLLVERGDPEKGEALLQRALTVLREADQGADPRAAALRQSIAIAQLALDRHEEAVPLLEEALAIRRAHPDDARALAQILGVLGRAHLELDEAEAARPLLEESLTLGEGEGVLEDLERCAISHRLAQAYTALERPGEARQMLATTVERLAQLVDSQDPRLVSAHRDLELASRVASEVQPREASFDGEDR